MKFSFIAIMWMLTSHTSLHAQPLIQYNSNPSNLVVRFVEHIGEIDFSLDAPSVEIYGDGRVVVFYPDYMKRAGRYQLKLSSQALDKLLSDMSNEEIPNFDTTVAKQNLDEAVNRQIQSGVRFASTDPSVTILELNLSSYSANLAIQSPSQINRRIVWKGLRSDAKQYPSVSAVQSLYVTHQKLWGLMEHPDLVRLKEENQ